MAPPRMTVNGVDLSTYGMWVEVPRGFLDSPHRQERLVDVQGAGSALIPEAAKLGERNLIVQGIITGLDFATVAGVWDQIKLHLASPWLEVGFVEFPDRIAVCRYQDFEWQGVNWAMGGWRFSLSLLSPSAYLFSPQLDPYMLSAGVERALDLGTAPSPFVIEFIGPATTPTLTYRDVNGQQRGSFHLTATLLAREWLRYTSQGHAMEMHSATGGMTNGAPFFANDSRQFQLDPSDGVPERGPSLLLDSGNALLYVRKAFR